MKAKTKLYKLLSLLLCCVMLVGLLPTTAFADYETGMECPDCGHYHWDTYMCFCGYCSEECTNATCWAENHCVRCGTCHEVTAYCAECGWCQECMEEEGHCLDCYKCVDSDDDLCQTCGKCEDCVGWLCMDCGQCDECTDDGEFHCEECGGCYETNGHNHGTHCADCCEICDQCGECIILNETEFCYECGLCEACCEENRDASDCSCGEYCVESVEFEEHFCEFCGNCFDDVDQCELCYLCVECCADNSDCSDGMCVEDSDYEEHFCEDCGSCFHDADQCETCADEGELRCVFCCESLASSYGCSCGEYCVESVEFKEHLDTVHSEDGEIGAHDPKPQNVWSMDGTDHWHGCRLCNEDAHITDKANHTYDKYGVCTVCGFKQGAAVFITHQPKDTYAKVTDINAGESDPLHSQNNKVSFKVSAYGEGLRYQWYRVAGTGAPVALTTSDPRVPSYGEGATTDKVTVSVPGDACTTVYTYYCVVTDKDGHTAESIHARIKAGHVYSRCQNVATGTEKTIYIQSGETYVTKKYQDSEGHFWSCCGEEDFGDGVTDFGNTRTKAPVNHSYGNQELIQATIYSDYAQAGKFSTYYRYTCSDCGHQIYVEKHTHNFECPVPGTEENNKYLEEHCTALTHPLVCTVGGCIETRTEQHRWEPWRIADYPTAEGPGHMRRECLDCQYPQDKEWTDKNGDPVQWTTANMLVTAVHGTVNRSMAAPGDKLTLTPEQIDGQKCTGWTADYTDYSGETRVTKTVSVTVTQNSDGTWSCTVPTFAAMDVNGGGQLGFEAQFAACSHTGGTKTEGAREPVCTRNGYTGDKVCVDCGQILTVGDPIPGGTEHTGTLTLVPGTEVKADCTHRGYTGDFKCSACGGIVAGERTGYDHSTEGYDLVGYVAPTCTTEGYSGDEVCSNCRKVVSHGKNLPAAHGKTETVNFLSPTCTASGYSGDKVCKICGETVEWGKTTPPRGHNWNTGTVTKQPTETERGERLLTCLTCSETKIEYNPRLSVSDELITRVSASVQRPIMGETPAEAVSSKPEQYTVIRTVWVGGTPVVFQPDTQYKVRITLKANDGYRFPAVGDSFQGYVNGNTATIGDRSTDQVTIEYTFPKTMLADHVHEFNKEMTDPEALAREADCTSNALYYYSCECGKIGTAETAGTFEYEDSALGHDWSKEWSTDADNHWHVCTRCSAIDSDTKAAHDFGDDDICDTCKYNREPSVADITAANVTVTAPTKGGTPVGAATTDTQYTVANTVWEPANNPFAPNTVYSVLVTLEAKEGYQFTASTVFKINDSTATVVTQSAEEAKISFTFPATEAETSLKWIPVPAAKTGLTYTGSELTGVKAGTGYTLTGNTATDAGSYTAVATLSSGYMWSDGTSEDKSIPWSIAKAMQAAPTGLTGIAPTEGNSDGKITGVTEQMEYRAEDASVYTLCFGTEITGLAAGNYFVRYKEDANHFASADTLVSVGSTATADVFTITFDANGGEGSMSAESVPAGTNYVLPACGFTAPDGKEFDKWQIGETDYAVGATYTVNDNTTIKAVWKNKTAPTTTYTVSFAAGDGTGSMSAQTVNAGTEYELPACGFTAPANKEFRAWSIGGTEHAPGDKFTVNADTTVTAVWKDKPVEITSFEITFNANGGSVTTTSATTGADGKLATLPTPTRSGYRFNGWYTAASGGTKVTTSYQFTADTTVYAHWTKKTPSGPSGSGSNSGTTIIQSAKTADIGVMIYGMTALLSLTGGAWVVNKKRKGK